MQLLKLRAIVYWCYLRVKQGLILLTSHFSWSFSPSLLQFWRPPFYWPKALSSTSRTFSQSLQMCFPVTFILRICVSSTTNYKAWKRKKANIGKGFSHAFIYERDKHTWVLLPDGLDRMSLPCSSSAFFFAFQ